MQRVRSFKERLLGSRYIAAVPVPYHSPVAGVVAGLGGAVLVTLPYRVDFLKDPFMHTFLYANYFGLGFLLAMGLSFYLKERKLVFREGRIDILYSVIYTTIPDLFIVLLWMLLNRYIIVSLFGAIVWNVAEALTLSRLMHRGLTQPRLLDDQASLTLPTSLPEVNRNRWSMESQDGWEVWVRDNPYRAPAVGYALIGVGLFFAILPRLLGMATDLRALGWVFLLGAFLAGFAIASAPIFYNRRVALPLRGSRLWVRSSFSCVSVSSLVFYGVLFGLLYYSAVGIGWVVAQALSATVGSLIASGVALKKLHAHWQAERTTEPTNS